MDLSNYTPEQLHDELLENVQYDDAWDSQEELLLEVCKAILDRNLDVLSATVATGNGKTEVARVLMTTLNYLSDQGIVVVFITTNNQLLAEMEELAHNGENILVMAGRNNFTCETAKKLDEKGENFVLKNGQERPVRNLHFKASNSLSKQYPKLFDFDKYGVCCNYERLVNGNFSFEETESCEYVRRMKKMEDILRGDIKGAIASNMDHFLSNRVYKKDIKTDEDREIDLLLVDEADELRKKVEQQNQIEIDSSFLNQYQAFMDDDIREPKFHKFGGNVQKKDSKREFELLLDHYVSSFNEAKDELNRTPKNFQEFQLEQKFYQIKDVYEKYMYYRNKDSYMAYNAEGQSLSKHNSDGWSVKAFPVDVGHKFEKHLQNVNTTILMSATINDETVDVFQISEFAECRHVDISDMRQYYNNLILSFDGDVTGKLSNDGDRYNKKGFKKSMEVLDFLLTETIHKKEKGIIHTTSYKKADQIVQGLQNRGHSHRVVRNPSSDEEEDLSKGLMSIETFQETQEPIIMVGVNKERGVDLKQSQGRFNVIFSVPYPPMYSPKNKEKAEFVDNLMDVENDKAYQMYQSVEEVLRDMQQASGRTSRTPEDYSIVYILDNRFNWFWESDAKGRARKWFKDKLSILKSEKSSRSQKMKDVKEQIKEKIGGTYMRQRENMKEEGKVLFETDEQYQDTIRRMEEEPLHKRVVPADGTKSLDSLNRDNSPYSDDETSVTQPDMEMPSNERKVDSNSSSSDQSSREQSKEESVELDDDDFDIAEPSDNPFGDK